MENKSAEEIANSCILKEFPAVRKKCSAMIKSYAQLESKEWDKWKLNNGWYYNVREEQYARIHNLVEVFKSHEELYQQYLTDKNK